MSERPTKERLLEAAEELILEKSFHSVGLTEILKAVKVPKGSFYHHFDSKEDFGIELIKHYVADASAWKRDKLLKGNLDADPLDRLFGMLEEGVAMFQESGGRCPCLIVKLAAEVSSFSEGMRAELAKGFKDWVSIYRQLLEEAKEEELIAPDLDCDCHAQLIHDYWFGAVLRAIACQSIKPLRNAIKIFKASLQAPTLT